MEDSHIIELYFKRDENAIAQTKIKYGRLCFGIIHNILGNAEDSEECLNDTMYGVWNAIPPARPSNFKAYLCKISRNQALKRLEYNKAAKRSPECIVSLSELESVIPDSRIPPELDDSELGELIGSFLKSLKPEARKVFIRKYWFFDSISDISARYGFSESKIKNMLYHTRKNLRDYLEKEGIVI